MYPELCQCKVQRITKTLPIFTSMLRERDCACGGGRQTPDLVRPSNSSAPLPPAFPGAAPAIPIGQAAHPSTCSAVTRESPRKATGSEGRRPGALRPRRRGFAEEKAERTSGGMSPGGERLMGTRLGRANGGQGEGVLGGPGGGRRWRASCRQRTGKR